MQTKWIIVLIAAMQTLWLGGCAASSRRANSSSIDHRLDSVLWMAGSWVSEGNDGREVSEEHWMQPRGGTMFGMNRTIHDGETAFYEYLCIEHTPEGTFYLASPKGKQPPTPFKMMANESLQSQRERVVFENPEHDFPTRIIYWRQGNTLHGRTEGKQNGQDAAEEWTWTRVR